MREQSSFLFQDLNRNFDAVLSPLHRHAIIEVSPDLLSHNMYRTYLVKSLTRKSGLQGSIWSREWDVRTARVLQPAARPLRTPDGASSMTRPENVGISNIIEGSWRVTDSARLAHHIALRPIGTDPVCNVRWDHLVQQWTTNCYNGFPRVTSSAVTNTSGIGTPARFKAEVA